MSEPLGVDRWAALRNLPPDPDGPWVDVPALLENRDWWEQTCDYWNTAAKEAQAMRDMNAARAERAEADLAAMTEFRDECERQYQAAVHAQGQAEADLADEKRRRAGLRAAVEAFLWALDNNANAEPDDMWEPIVIPAATALRALLDTATEEGL